MYGKIGTMLGKIYARFSDNGVLLGVNLEECLSALHSQSAITDVETVTRIKSILNWHSCMCLEMCLPLASGPPRLEDVAVEGLRPSVP